VYEILQKKLSRHLFLFFYTELYGNKGVQILSIGEILYKLVYKSSEYNKCWM